MPFILSALLFSNWYVSFPEFDDDDALYTFVDYMNPDKKSRCCRAKKKMIEKTFRSYPNT